MIVLILRTLIVYLLIIVAMRLMGKRQLGQLQPSELVSTIFISNLASISIESQELPLSASIVPVFLIVALELCISAICLQFPKVAQLISGTPIAVIRDGVIDQKALRELRFSASDLLEALRSKDIFDPQEVSYALIETNGTISVCKLHQKDLPTREDLNIALEGTEKPMVPFIVDGKVLVKNLCWCKKSTNWVFKILEREHLTLKQTLILLGNETETYQIIKKAVSNENSSETAL